MPRDPTLPLSAPAGVALPGTLRAGYEGVLTSDALAFVADLARKFGPRVPELLARRRARTTFDFLPETAKIRASDWTVGPLPKDLAD